jgi:hypothetical protein
MSARLAFFLCGWVACFSLVGRVQADDDPLPDFTKPVDNSPLNADKVDRSMGATLFQAPSLWDEDAEAVAKRLGWPEESRTSTQSSYRLYPSANHPLTIFGAQAYSCVLYGGQDKPTEVSIVFVNVGDYPWKESYATEAAKLASSLSHGQETQPQLSDDDLADVQKKVQENFEKALKDDAQKITAALTALFGDPSHEKFGGGSETSEQVRRWDWQGHSFLLSIEPDKYVALRIVTVAFADNYGKADKIERDDLRALLLQRVKRSESGDVVVTEIPMVDQGPKGYCVPATWERYLRFLGIPADMYVLAMAAGSGQQGTDLDAMIANVDSLVTLYHRRIDGFSGDLDMKMIAKNIDSGLPLMWTCDIHVPFEKAVSKRQKDRAAVTDWKQWAATLETQDATQIPKEITGTPVDGGHQRMIIGYNEATGEIAISDSWSKAFAIRWMTLREANAINLGHSYVIEP